jgi:LmbE family N-acetylglucosaminyl deacetylase
MNEKMQKRALVVAAHSDDEALGCGGTIARLVVRGWDVGVIFMTNGVGARSTSTEDSVKERDEAAARALKAMGARLLQRFDFPDNAMDSVPLLELARAVESVAATFPPQLILTHHAHDLNVDHRLVHQAVITAFRPLPGSPVEAILCFEVPSSTGWSSTSGPIFNPACWVDVAESFASKIEALRCYDVEMRPPPHPRSQQTIEALARFRGSQSGLEFAEAFEVQRVVHGGAASLLGVK